MSDIIRDSRSLFHFAVLVVVAIATTLFLLEKTRQAMAEIKELEDSPIFIKEK